MPAIVSRQSAPLAITLVVCLTACARSFGATADASNTFSNCGYRRFANVLDLAALNRVLASIRDTSYKDGGFDDGAVKDALQEYGGALVTWGHLVVDLPQTARAIGAPTSMVLLKSAAVVDHPSGLYQLVFLKIGGGLKASRWRLYATGDREFVCGNERH